MEAVVEVEVRSFEPCTRRYFTSLHFGEAAREYGLDLFGATLTLGSILVDLGELELHAVDHVIASLDGGVVVGAIEPIDHVLVELDLLELGVDGRRRRLEGVFL